MNILTSVGVAVEILGVKKALRFGIFFLIRVVILSEAKGFPLYSAREDQNQTG